MIQISVNGSMVNILQPVIGDVHTLTINKNPMFIIPVDHDTAISVKSWLIDVVNRCDGVISYNGTLMYKEDCGVNV